MLRHFSCVVSEICEGKMVTRQIIRFIGDTVVLQCRTTSNGSMQWHRGVAGDKFIASTSRGVSLLYPRLSLNDSTEGQFDLLINSTQQRDADIYSCAAGFNRVAQTELTLLGKCFVLYINYYDAVSFQLIILRKCAVVQTTSCNILTLDREINNGLQ